MRTITIILALLTEVAIFSQQTAITFSNHGNIRALESQNPFSSFIGEWTLKNGSWTQNWGGTTETIKIPNHHTVSTQINTSNSLFSIIDGPEPNGHIFWSYNPVTKAVHHLSSFDKIRAGVGVGSISESGDVTLKISFEGEPKDTYRMYKYTWITQDEYHMKSVQYTMDDKPTGLFYEGTFVRLSNQYIDLKTQVETILKVMDNPNLSVQEQLEVYTDDIVHMAPGSELNYGKEALGNYLKEQRQNGEVSMKHEVLEIEQQGDVVIMRGQVNGIFYPKNESAPMEFRTKNLFIFDNKEGNLKISKVIYNMSPPNNK